MNQHARRVIRVTPTITGVTYANNDILFDTTEIPLLASDTTTSKCGVSPRITAPNVITTA